MYWCHNPHTYKGHRTQILKMLWESQLSIPWLFLNQQLFWAILTCQTVLPLVYFLCDFLGLDCYGNCLSSLQLQSCISTSARKATLTVIKSGYSWSCGEKISWIPKAMRRKESWLLRSLAITEAVEGKYPDAYSYEEKEILIVEKSGYDWSSSIC